MSALSTPYCTITAEAWARLRDSQGVRFTRQMGIAPDKYADDTLDPRKAEDMADVLVAYTPLAGKRVLEIGTGCGVNHIVWQKKYGIDAWGVEPEGDGFENSAAIARSLIAANGLDIARIKDAPGEQLPFPDAHFDIVYSSNVLEHTSDPAQVLREALRVLKPGGVMQIVCPNYFSYFDGHYGAIHPPILSNGFFRWWMKWIYRKDPWFAGTIRTEINPFWVRRQIKALGQLDVLTLGQDKFRERMTTADVGRWMALGTVGKIVGLGHKLGVNRLAAASIIALQGWTPLIITARKSG
jgi:ubiquinone/menaquinone biosynthesis C-methylase UbiE